MLVLIYCTFSSLSPIWFILHPKRFLWVIRECAVTLNKVSRLRLKKTYAIIPISLDHVVFILHFAPIVGTVKDAQ